MMVVACVAIVAAVLCVGAAGDANMATEGSFGPTENFPL
jgi:hypothetical protein